MYHLDMMTSFNYDRSGDIITIEPEPEVLALSEYVTCIDTGNVILNVGDYDNIRSIEILNAAHFFGVTKDVFIKTDMPEIKFDSYDGGVYLLDIFFKNIGTIRAAWGNIKPHCMLMHGATILLKKGNVRHGTKP